MSDVTCPYCKAEQEINHDDGYGYEECETYDQRCRDCDKEFSFETSISFNYEVFCQGEHDMFQPIIERNSDFWTCDNCDFSETRRTLTNPNTGKE